MFFPLKARGRTTLPRCQLLTFLVFLGFRLVEFVRLAGGLVARNPVTLGLLGVLLVGRHRPRRENVDLDDTLWRLEVADREDDSTALGLHFLLDSRSFGTVEEFNALCRNVATQTFDPSYTACNARHASLQCLF